VLEFLYVLKIDSHRMQRLADALHVTMARYGYRLVDTPVIQAADLFLTKAGDQIVSKLFTFERHSQQLALRPEFTATAAYNYVTEQDQSIVRWQFSGPIFEDDPANNSSHYQRSSIGAELIGLGGPAADAEIISMSVKGLIEKGLERWSLVIGHAGLMRQLLAQFGLNARTERFLLNHLYALKDPALGKSFIIERLDKLSLVQSGQSLAGQADTNAEMNTQQMLDTLLDVTQRNITMGGRSRHDIVRRLLQKRQRLAEHHQIVAALEFLERWGQIKASPEQAFMQIQSMVSNDDIRSQQMLSEWQQSLDLLNAYGIPADRIEIHPDLARSWDYYTGIVFELYSDDLHLAGGGRYDELIRIIGGSDVPAVGFVYYPDQLVAALPEVVTIDEQTVTLLFDETSQVSAVHWAEALRERGMTVELLPASYPVGDAPTIELLADGRAKMSGNFYTLPDVDVIVVNLK
jgi:histidyl-tRNA synthetase